MRGVAHTLALFYPSPEHCHTAAWLERVATVDAPQTKIPLQVMPPRRGGSLWSVQCPHFIGGAIYNPPKPPSDKTDSPSRSAHFPTSKNSSTQSPHPLLMLRMSDTADPRSE